MIETRRAAVEESRAELCAAQPSDAHNTLARRVQRPLTGRALCALRRRCRCCRRRCRRRSSLGTRPARAVSIGLRRLRAHARTRLCASARSAAAADAPSQSSSRCVLARVTSGRFASLRTRLERRTSSEFVCLIGAHVTRVCPTLAQVRPRNALKGALRACVPSEAQTCLPPEHLRPRRRRRRRRQRPLLRRPLTVRATQSATQLQRLPHLQSRRRGSKSDRLSISRAAAPAAASCQAQHRLRS